MAGILNNKERMIDFIVTQEGKRQAGTGELRIRFATFTDSHTFYEKSGSLSLPNLAADASNRIFFEAHNRYQDVIVPELEAGGYMRSVQTKNLDMIGNTIVSGSLRLAVSGNQVLSGTALEPALVTLLDGITENFTDQKIIGSIDEFSAHQNIEISPSTGSFSVDDNTMYLRSGQNDTVNIDNAPSVFSDARFGEFPNFKYLPPENVPLPGAANGTLLGNYPRFNEREISTLEDMVHSLDGKQKQAFSFSKTSRANNNVIQFFEQGKSGVEKLASVDFGMFTDDESETKQSRVIFVGKMLYDAFGSETFMCLFTVIFR